MTAFCLAGTAQAKVTAHHALWKCISDNEGAPYSVNPNGHYNLLQMTWGWLGIIHGNPNNYTPAQIFEAAETGYRQSNYSRSFLIGQWLRWDGAYYCLRYAE